MHNISERKRLNRLIRFSITCSHTRVPSCYTRIYIRIYNIYVYIYVESSRLRRYKWSCQKRRRIHGTINYRHRCRRWRRQQRVSLVASRTRVVSKLVSGRYHYAFRSGKHETLRFSISVFENISPRMSGNWVICIFLCTGISGYRL